MTGELRVVINAPSGDELDVTSRVEVGGISEITLEPETDLSVMGHGNVGLELLDHDGVVRAFLKDATTTDVFDVTIDRQSLDGTGWLRIFGGILHVPDSIVYDNKEKTVKVECYSYTKLMENTPADTLTRLNAYIDRTASITVGTNQLVFPDGSNQALDLASGDVLSLRTNSGATAQFTIKRVIDGSNVLTTQPAGETITGAYVTLDTGFTTDLSPQGLAQAIADECGFDLDTASFDDEIASFPIMTPLPYNGISFTGYPISLVAHGTWIVSCWEPADDEAARYMSSPLSRWYALTIPFNDYEVDWQPYLLTEPGTILHRARFDNYAIDHDGNTQPPYAMGTIGLDYVASVRCYTAGLSVVVGDEFQIYRSVYKVAGSPAHWWVRLALRKNGVHVGYLIDMDAGSVVPGFPDARAWLEWDTFSNVLWCSYQVISTSGGAPIERKFGYFPNPAFATFIAADATISGPLRYCRGLGPDGTMILYNSPWTIESGNAAGGGLRFYSSGSFVGTFNYLGQYVFNEGYPLVWSLRHTTGYIALLYQNGPSVNVIILDSRSFEVSVQGVIPPPPRVVTFMIAPSILSFRAYLTVWTLTGGRKIFVGYAGGEWFILSKRYDGVIRYAGFKSKSCADAAASLAIITNAIVSVDDYRTLSFRGRRSLGLADVSLEIESPLEDLEKPLSEVYRASVQVKGETGTGGAIDVVIGETGASAKRLTIDNDLITTAGMAAAVGVSTYQFVSQVRSEREVKIENGGEPVRPFETVTIGGTRYFVYKSSIDVEQRHQGLTLLEVV